MMRVVISFLCLMLIDIGLAKTIQVVSLSPDITDVIEQIKEQSGKNTVEVVGVIHYPGEPPSQHSLAGVGSAGALNIEKIILLQPDVVLASKMNRRQSIETLRHFGVNIQVVDAGDLESIATFIKAIGQAIHLSDSARVVAKTYLEHLHALKKRYQHNPHKRLFLQLSRQPIYAVGGKGLINKVVHFCHGRNIFDDVNSAAFQAHPSDVLMKNPDIILLLLGPLSNSQPITKNQHSQWQPWRHLSAVHFDQVYDINPNLLAKKTPDILTGVNIVCQLIKGLSENNLND